MVVDCTPCPRARSEEGPNSTQLYAWPPQLELENVKELGEFQIIDFICNTFFTLELAIRFLCCPDKRRFVRRILNIIDLVALISFYADITILVLGM